MPGDVFQLPAAAGGRPGEARLLVPQPTSISEGDVKDVLCLGVDLASKRFEDIGTATLSFSTSDPPSWTECRVGVIDWPDERLTPAAVVRAIDEFAVKHGVVAVSIDGPQGWHLLRPAAGPASVAGASTTPGPRARRESAESAFPARTSAGSSSASRSSHDCSPGEPNW